MLYTSKDLETVVILEVLAVDDGENGRRDIGDEKEDSNGQEEREQLALLLQVSISSCVLCGSRCGGSVFLHMKPSFDNTSKLDHNH